MEYLLFSLSILLNESVVQYLLGDKSSPNNEIMYPGNKPITMTFKEHLKSALITFFVAFSIAVVPFIDSLSLETLKNGALFGILFAGVRAGVKAILEIVAKYRKE
jgi:hypothetical protein